MVLGLREEASRMSMTSCSMSIAGPLPWRGGPAAGETLLSIQYIYGDMHGRSYIMNDKHAVFITCW